MIDLHVHTTASDGENSPTDIVLLAKEKGVEAIAITDHDNVDGIAEAMQAGIKNNVEIIPGIEISAEYEKDMHILGYYIDINSESIKNMIKTMKEKRNKRNEKIIEVFNKMGIDINMQDVLKHVKGDVIAKPHFAKALLEKGYVQDFEEAFSKFLKVGELAKVERERFTPQESIKLIRDSGGIAVLAHPKSLELNDADLEQMIIKLKGYGLEGIESIYAFNNKGQTETSIALAKKYDLLITAGTDYHGPKVDERVEIGNGIDKNVNASYEIVQKMKELLKNRK